MGYHLHFLSYLANLTDDLPSSPVCCDRVRQQVPRLLEHSFDLFGCPLGPTQQTLIGWNFVGKKNIWLAQIEYLQSAWMYSLHRAVTSVASIVKTCTYAKLGNIL